MSESPFFLFGISGKARHGKDTAAAFLREEAAKAGYNLLILHLALPLKARVYGASPDATIADVMYNKPAPIRSALQQEGTELGRDVYGDQFWIRQLEYFIAQFQSVAPFVHGVIVPDVRFPNEADYIKQHNGATIQILSDRPTLTGEAALHRSETALDSYDKEFGFAYTLFNNQSTSLDELRKQVNYLFHVEEAYVKGELN
jgi:hypothetical protein